MSKQKETKKKKNNQIAKKLIGICLILASIAILTNVGFRLKNIIDLKSQSKVVEEELQKLKDENATLISTRDKLEDPNYVQTFARGEYMFSMSNEKVFYLPAESEE